MNVSIVTSGHPHFFIPICSNTTLSLLITSSDTLGFTHLNKNPKFVRPSMHSKLWLRTSLTPRSLPYTLIMEESISVSDHSSPPMASHTLLLRLILHNTTVSPSGSIDILSRLGLHYLVKRVFPKPIGHMLSPQPCFLLIGCRLQYLTTAPLTPSSSINHLTTSNFVCSVAYVTHG